MNDRQAKAEHSGIVVGIDGSPHSINALRWCLPLVPTLGRLRPVHTWQIPWWAYGPASPGVWAPLPGPELQRRAERELDDALRGVDPELIDGSLVCEGPAGPTLVDVAAGAQLLVVGTRGRNALTDLVLGSVSLHCASHARRVPVAVIPLHGLGLGVGDEVVVGIDGSANARAALRWALQNLPMASVLAVGCWGLEVYGGFEIPAVPTVELRDGVRDEVHKAVEAVAQIDPTWRDRIRIEVHPGDPRGVLTELASKRSALILGARGHRGLAGLVLGSVTTALIHHPVVPTIVVPEAGP